MAQPVFRGDEGTRDRPDERMQQNRKMELWILLSAVGVTLMTRGPTRTERMHETEGTEP